MSRASCRPCRQGDHDHCTGDVYDPDTERLAFCGCSPTHDYEHPDPPLPDPYHTDAAEDAELDRRIGERFGGERP